MGINLHSLLGEVNRELSSARSEHLPYKQRVGGSNPSAPTKEIAASAAICIYMEFDKVFFFYIIYSSVLDRFYYGHTGDELNNRLRKHNSNHQGFSGRTGDWVVVYSEVFQTKAEAYKRERQIKGWKNRRRVEQLINEKA